MPRAAAAKAAKVAKPAPKSFAANPLAPAPAPQRDPSKFRKPTYEEDQKVKRLLRQLTEHLRQISPSKQDVKAGRILCVSLFRAGQARQVLAVCLSCTLLCCPALPCTSLHL